MYLFSILILVIINLFHIFRRKNDPNNRFYTKYPTIYTTKYATNNPIDKWEKRLPRHPPLPTKTQPTSLNTQWIISHNIETEDTSATYHQHVISRTFLQHPGISMFNLVANRGKNLQPEKYLWGIRSYAS